MAEEEDGGDSDADSEADEAEGGEDGGESADPAGGRREVLGSVDNKCALVWQGVVPKRTFTGFKFQVSFHSQSILILHLECSNNH